MLAQSRRHERNAFSARQTAGPTRQAGTAGIKCAQAAQRRLLFSSHLSGGVHGRELMLEGLNDDSWPGGPLGRTFSFPTYIPGYARGRGVVEESGSRAWKFRALTGQFQARRRHDRHFFERRPGAQGRVGQAGGAIGGRAAAESSPCALAGCPGRAEDRAAPAELAFCGPPRAGVRCTSLKADAASASASALVSDSSERSVVERRRLEWRASALASFAFRRPARWAWKETGEMLSPLDAAASCAAAPACSAGASLPKKRFLEGPRGVVSRLGPAELTGLLCAWS